MRFHWQPLIVLFSVLLAAPAVAQQEAVHWQHDLEAAKIAAKESGRLVLIHFWTPSCGPCMALDKNVFNQPGVASAIETQYVPVKMNADENSATAQWYGITRVPTDVVATPDGQVVAKMVSPPTSAAYVAELTSMAGKYAARSGQAYAGAVAAAPVQSQLNSAYARLPVSPNAPLAIAPTTTDASPNFPSVPTATTAVKPAARQTAPGALAATPVGQSFLAQSPTAPSNAPFASPPMAPQVIANPAALSSQAGTPTQPPITPIATPPGVPAQVTNPYLAVAVPPAAESPSAASASIGAVPDPRLLPPGAPPLAFEGYCPVSMRNAWKWVPGNPQYGIVHLGRTYWFAGPEEQKQFWTDPARYAPALSGNDPVLSIDHKQEVPGKREHSLDYDGLFYMFASEATLQQFSANPARYAAGVRQAMGIPRGRLVR